MNTNPTLSELIQTAINTVSRIEVILDRAEERSRKIDEMLVKFAAIFPDEDEDADVRWAPAFDLPEPALPSHQADDIKVAPAGSLAAKLVRFAVLDEVDRYPSLGSAPLEPAVLDANGHKPTLDESMADACGFERPTPEAPRKNPSGPDRIAVTELDPTKRDLPMGTDWPPLPELPEGKTRWVNRGHFQNVEITGAPRHDGTIMYFDGDKWCDTTSLSGPFPHIEAIAEPVAEEPAPAPAPVTDEPKPRLIPEVGAYYWLRNGLTARILAKSGDDSFDGELHGIDADKWLPFHWHADGTPYGTGDSQFDLVELAPF